MQHIKCQVSIKLGIMQCMMQGMRGCVSVLPGGVVAGGWQAEGALLLLDQSAARGQSRLQRLWHVSCVTPSLSLSRVLY